MTRPRATNADAVTVAAELRACLSGVASAPDQQAAVDDAVAFVTAVEERCAAGIRMLISDISEASSEREVQLKLLGALLDWAANQTVEQTDAMIDVQLQCLQLVSARLGDGRDVRRWLQLGDQVLAALRHNAALLVKQDPQDNGNEARVDSGESRRYMVKIASILMQLREKVATADNTLRDLKIETFVWKVRIARTESWRMCG